MDDVAAIKPPRKPRAKKVTEPGVVKRPSKISAKLLPNEKLARIVERIEAFEYPKVSFDMPELVAPPPGMLALDFETHDPTLIEKGSAWAFPGIGSIIGVAVAWEGFDAYYPIRHVEGNYEYPEQVLNWLADQMRRPDIKLLCMNANYDIGWARRELGFYPVGGCVDLQHMAALIWEHEHSYSLEATAQKYLGVGKETTLLEKIEEEMNLTHSQVMSALRNIPGYQIVPYGRMDARRTYDAAMAMLPILKEQELENVFQLESDLIPMSVEMRRIGIRVDVERAENMAADIRDNQIPQLQKEVKAQTGIAVDPWKADEISDALYALGLDLGVTKTGKKKVDVASLHAVKHPVAEMISRMRKLSKIEGTFINGHILGHAHDGRVHPEFNQLKSESEDGLGRGTVTGRYSVTSPAMQQLPTRDPEFGPLFRRLILPEEGEQVASLDYSSQEPRLTVHFAYQYNIRGASEAVMRFRANPRTDYHQLTADLCGIARKDAKAINLGLAYGMGGAKLARSLGLPTAWKSIRKETVFLRNGDKLVRDVWADVLPSAMESLQEEHGSNIQFVEVAGPQAKAIIDKWREGAPFIKGLSDLCQSMAKHRGYLTTLSGRRVRFQKVIKNVGTPEEVAEYMRIHKAMNSLIQSSAADQTKEAARLMWRRGIVPMILIHDETVLSGKGTEKAEAVAECMREAYTLEVPTVVDIKYGATLGDIDK